MAEESAPLRQLLQKNVQWHWSEEHTKSLDSLKTFLTKAPVLKYYAINEPLVLSVDASSEGLGAVLLQNQQYDSNTTYRSSTSLENKCILRMP